MQNGLASGESISATLNASATLFISYSVSGQYHFIDSSRNVFKTLLGDDFDPLLCIQTTSHLLLFSSVRPYLLSTEVKHASRNTKASPI